MRWNAVWAGVLLPLFAASAVDAAAAVSTPAPGSAERRAILDALREGRDVRFIVRALRVHEGQAGGIAHVMAEAEDVPAAEHVLVRAGDGRWRTIFSDGEGGAETCGRAVEVYGWLLGEIRRRGVAPDALMPGVEQRVAEFRAAAPDDMCAGDLSAEGV